MDAAVEALFQYTRSKVTVQDIIDFAPGDPSYGHYVRLWTKILRSGSVPEMTEFNLSEVIGLTGWGNPDDWENPDRFRAFRRFTSAVGVVLIHHGNDSSIVRPPGYLAWDLIADLDLSDSRHLPLLREVFRATRVILSTTYLDEEYPFFTFGLMILAQRARDWTDSESWASQLILDEGAVRNHKFIEGIVWDNRFLLGLTNYGQFNRNWISQAQQLENPNGHDDTALVTEVLRSARK